MKILVKQITDDNDATLSAVFIDGKFQCFGLEDEDRAFKIPGKTRIGRGTYKIGLRYHGGFHENYKKRFDFHNGMLEILDVKNFSDVLIHIGNTHKDTAGCLLVGTGAETNNELRVINSKNAYIDFYKKVINSAINGKLLIEYI